MSQDIATSNDRARVPFADLIDLAAEQVGGRALAANDEFFAEKENLLKPGRGVFIPGKFTDRGKWMDGWETRRRRTPGFDWCVIRLGLPGEIRGFDVDTNHFVGNFPEFCSIEACEAADAAAPAEKLQGWTEILPKSRLQGGTRNLFPVPGTRRWTHVRLNIFPDGGVARLRVHGVVRPDWAKLRARGEAIDLAAAENGGTVVSCNDSFFGPKDNLILPGRAANMGEGWETRRKRGPGHDWIVVKLGAPGKVRKLEVDTNHFKGNFPDRCSLEGCEVRDRELLHDELVGGDLDWREILPQTKLRADHRHFFEGELRSKGRVFTHVRLNIHPDGGVSRLRVHGDPE
jgi:allantoicase